MENQNDTKLVLDMLLNHVYEAEHKLYRQSDQIKLLTKKLERLEKWKKSLTPKPPARLGN